MGLSKRDLSMELQSQIPILRPSIHARRVNISVKFQDLYGFTVEGNVDDANILNVVRKKVREQGKLWWGLEASKWANCCLQTHVTSDLKSSLKFSVLVNGITVEKLIRKGIPPVLRPKVWFSLSGVAKKNPIVPDSYYNDIGLFDINVVNYYEIIQEPMDFRTMRAKLHEGLYTFLNNMRERNAFQLFGYNLFHVGGCRDGKGCGSTEVDGRSTYKPLLDLNNERYSKYLIHLIRELVSGKVIGICLIDAPVISILCENHQQKEKLFQASDLANKEHVSKAEARAC
ncbi:growth hormone-regulated TBC protein 1-like protein [Tanacetum coccineum]